MDGRYGVVLVSEFGPPAFGSDIPGAGRPSWKQLRVRLSATESDGKRDSGT
jgi:hypothetical protein